MKLHTSKAEYKHYIKTLGFYIFILCYVFEGYAPYYDTAFDFDYS